MQFKSWFETTETKKQRVGQLIDGPNFILFFTNNNAVFGAPEESRLVFAKMMNPEDEEESWVDDANFLAFDLIQALAGKKVQTIFSNKDLKSIKVIDKDKAEKMLMTCPLHGDSKLATKQDKDGVGMIKLKDD